jgi:hypothetical protein
MIKENSAGAKLYYKQTSQGKRAGRGGQGKQTRHRT